MTVGEPGKDLSFLRGQALQFGGLDATVRRVLDDAGDQRWIEQRSAGGHAADGVDEISAGDLLEDVAEAPAMMAAKSASSSS